MSANVDKIYPSKPVTATKYHPSSAIGSATTDSPTNITELLTVGANGAQGGRLFVLPVATNNTATVMRLYRRKAGDAAGKWYLIDSKVLSAQTISSTSPVSPVEFTRFAAMDHEAGDTLGFGTDAATGATLSVDVLIYDLTAPLVA